MASSLTARWRQGDALYVLAFGCSRTGSHHRVHDGRQVGHQVLLRKADLAYGNVQIGGTIRPELDAPLFELADGPADILGLHNGPCARVGHQAAGPEHSP